MVELRVHRVSRIVFQLILDRVELAPDLVSVLRDQTYVGPLAEIEYSLHLGILALIV